MDTYVVIRKEVLKQLILNYQSELGVEKSIRRELQPKLQKKFATIISGIRRCGKSTLAKQLTKGKKTYYFHFENVQLAKFEQQDFAKLDEIFKEVLGENGIYLLDEVQNIPGWEIYVRQLVDTNNTVIVTGSNATMLSRELGTRLTGRNLRYELYPFSYKEYLRLRGKQPSKKTFDEHYSEGGFPEYLKTINEEILKNLFEDIFYRDILVRNDIRSEPELRQLVAFLSANIGAPISHNKLKEHLKLGSVTTVSQFIDACEQAYLFFTINIYADSIKKQQRNPKKVYCVDNGLLRLNAFSFSQDKGRYLENTAYMQLRRQGKEIYYHKEDRECDFITKEGTKIVEAIQVCYELHDENEERELEGLIEACKTHNLKEGLLLTHNQEDHFEKNGVKIIMKPVWKWLIE